MSKNIDELNKMLEKHFDKSGNSIISLSVANKSATYEKYINNGTNKDLFTFGIGSISKTMISTYLCKLEKDGLINFDQRVDEILNVKSKIKYPTILELATHTSGYHAYIPFVSSMKILLTKGFNKRNLYKNLNRKWIERTIEMKRPFKKKKYRYSDFNYAILALIIEEVVQQDFKTAMITFLQDEIGMYNTFYGNYELTSICPYSWTWNNDNPFLPSGGLFSTTEDMMLFLKYQIEHKEELEKSFKKYHKINAKKRIYTGFSWNSFLNGTYYWHIGGQGCYRSYALFDTKREIAISILTVVDIDLQHVGRLGSSMYRNTKRNHKKMVDFLEVFDPKGL